MNGYEIEELYYLYRQGCPIAQALLIEYCYWQIKMMMPAYCYTVLCPVPGLRDKPERRSR